MILEQYIFMMIVGYCRQDFYKECSNITERYEKLWGRWSSDSQLLHIITEVSELQNVLRNKNDKFGKFGTKEYLGELRSELADVFLTAFATANLLGIDIVSLNLALDTKLSIVKQRVKEFEEKTSQQNRKAVET